MVPQVSVMSVASVFSRAKMPTDNSHAKLSEMSVKEANIEKKISI